MATFEAKGEYAVPAEKLWAVVRDFGSVGWIQGISDVKVVGSGPGMTRILNGAIHETLESIDDARRVLTYTIPKGLPLPVKNYHATMKVDAAGPGKSQLTWTCRAEPDGVPEEQARQAVTGMYQTMLGWIRDYVKAG
jgi:hypothetical protein